MQAYKVQKNQNIYDVALYLLGSVEGVFELMANNPGLSYETELKEGDELYWDEKAVIHQSIVDEFHATHTMPANADRNIYYKSTNAELRCYIQVPNDSMSLALHMSGDHTMIVDWGDNSPLETITLQSDMQQYVHYFDNVVSERYIRLYGDFNLKTWDISPINGLIMPTMPLIVDELISQANNISLQGLLLFKGTYSVALSDMSIESLAPIRDMNLRYLQLANNQYIDESCIDAYLIYLATHNNQRRNCRVVLDVQPSGVYSEPPKDEHGNYIITTGMQAIYVILHEPAWNEAGPWAFDIKGVEYTADNLTLNHSLSLIIE